MSKTTINQNTYKMLHIELFQALLQQIDEAQQASLLQTETLLSKVEGGLHLLFLIIEASWHTRTGWDTRDDLTLGQDLVDRIRSFAHSVVHEHHDDSSLQLEAVNPSLHQIPYVGNAGH